jgi:SAM-dependent methyltransferase
VHIVISVSRIRKGVRLLKCKALGKPLDPELARDVHVLALRWRVWRSVVTRRPLDVRLHHEFNLWAAKGVGEGMDSPHRRLIEQALPKMDLAPGDHVLDLACGAGLSSRLIAASNARCDLVVGMDISNGMLSHARNQSQGFPNINFVCASAEHFPLPNNYFQKAFSVEAFYYFEHQDRVLSEFFRVLAPQGRLFLLICLYRDHAASLSTVDEVDVPVHVRTIEEYKSMLRDGGWIDVRAEEFVHQPPPGRKPDVHDRALFLSARKPDFSTRGPVLRG